eukprot:IDg21168t1
MLQIYMTRLTGVRRQERRLSSAVDAARSVNLNIRAAVDKFCISKSTLHDIVAGDWFPPHLTHRMALSAGEE